MKRKLWLAVSLLLIIALLVGGCSGQIIEEPPEEPSHRPPEEQTLPPSLPPRQGPPLPGKSLLEAARLEFEDFVNLKAGETKSLDVRIETLEHGPGEVACRIYRVAKEYAEDELPVLLGLDVNVEPPNFTAYPNNTYHSTITIKTNSELDLGEYVFLFDWLFEGVENGTGWITVDVQ
ncbi:hypothetical protein ACFLTP_03200 [Chloroflexota bacterium]